MQWVFPILCLVAITAASVLGLLAFRRRVPHASLSKHNDVAGVIFAIVGTLFAVLLAFVVVVVWETQGTADDRVELEAGALGDLMRDSGFFPDPERTELQSEFREYGLAVINEEWKAMDTGQSSPHVWDVLNKIYESFSRIKPVTAREINIHSEMLKRLNDLADHRRLRLNSADSKVPMLMWIVLIIGGAVTIAFTYLLGVERELSHVLMTGMLALMISLTLYLILAMDQPFGGELRVEPDAFQLVIDKIGPVDYSK